MNNNSNTNNTTIFLKDYQPPVFFINKTELFFELEVMVEEDSAKQETVTVVRIGIIIHIGSCVL